MKNQQDCQGPGYPGELFEGDYEVQGHSFHSLMPFKLRKVLLVASLYDAFIIEEEGLIPELVVGEYANLHLGSPPHVERVSSGARALQVLESKEQKWDLVITMSKNIGMDPVDFGRQVKGIKCDLPVVLLATDIADLHRVREQGYQDAIDKLFFWNGDSKLFLAIIKYIEDRENVKYDTISANVRVLIMVEDSVRYYSMFLPLIYLELMNQAGRLISEELNETQRRLRRRVRPKILLAESFEEGMALYETYRDNILGIISDVNYPYKGKPNAEAGCEFIRQIKEQNPYMPTLLQSSKLENQEKAASLGAYFLYKHNGASSSFS